MSEVYKDWLCKCGHEVVAREKPQPIKWTDGHICTFELDPRYTKENNKENKDVKQN